MKNDYEGSRRKGAFYIQFNGGGLTGLVTSCVRTAFYNTVGMIEQRGVEKEDVSNYWMTLRKQEDTTN
jgi:hypothetical protein